VSGFTAVSVVVNLTSVSAPARLMRTPESSPMRARVTRIRRFTTLPPGGLGTGQKGWSLDESAAPRKLEWLGGFLVWLGCDMQLVGMFGGVTRSSLERNFCRSK
jgi:hypothetical protein